MTGLELDQVSCRFGGPGGHLALDRLTLESPRGEITALLGPNGAGKTTALALAAGLRVPTSGSIRLKGRPVGPLNPPSSFGYLPQRIALPPSLTVNEIVDLAATARRSTKRDRDEIIESTGVSDMLERRVGELSSGRQRRLGLALALMEPAEMVLLDEPFVGLDLATLERCIAILQVRKEAGVIVLASHDFQVVDRLDARLAVLDEGRLIQHSEEESPPSRPFYEESLRKAMTAEAT